MEPLPDFGSLSDDELKDMIGDLEQQEREVSYQRRILHGKIDILRAELVARLQTSGGRSVLDQVDVDRLTEILTGKAAPPAVSVVYCSRVRLPEPGVRELLLALRRAAREGRVGGRDDAVVLAGGDRRRRAPRRPRDRGAGARRPRRRRQGGGELQADRRAHAHRPVARLRDLPRRRHRLAEPRRARRAATASSRSRTRAR